MSELFEGSEEMRMMRIEHSKQRCEKEGVYTHEQVTAHFVEKSSVLDRGIGDMEEGRELPLQQAMEKVSELRNERRNAKAKKDLYSLLGQGYKAIQEGCESSIDKVKEKIRKRRE